MQAGNNYIEMNNTVLQISTTGGAAVGQVLTATATNGTCTWQTLPVSSINMSGNINLPSVNGTVTFLGYRHSGTTTTLTCFFGNGSGTGVNLVTNEVADSATNPGKYFCFKETRFGFYTIL